MEVPPLPFGPSEQRHYCADGSRETATAEELGAAPGGEERPLFFYNCEGREEEEKWVPAARPLLPLRIGSGEVVDNMAAWAREHDAVTREIWSTPISATASGRLPAYRLADGGRHVRRTQLDHTALGTLHAALPSEDFLRDMCSDARDLVIGCAIHVCSPSCWKYHSNRASHICRHNFYHVITLFDEDGNEVRRRRRGKQLQGCLAIMVDTRYSMAGRVLTFQQHPFERPTNYAALVAARCNVDVQDMRRVLPPRLWVPAEELSGAPPLDPSDVTSAVPPQKIRDFSIGQREDWGWMQHMGTTTHRKHTVLVFNEWQQIFQDLANRGEAAPTLADSDDECTQLANAANAAAKAVFVDAHNTGYYINAYTTKLNPTMDTVLQRLLEGVRRLHDSWEAAAAPTPTETVGEGAASSSAAAPTNRNKQAFGRTMQVLSRFETAFRRASWKSGSEMLFPILFGHLSFTTHRCWCVFVKKATFLAAQAWRRHYGQMDTAVADASVAPLTYTLPDGGTVMLKGWRKELRDNAEVCLGPDGQEYNQLEHAAQAFAQEAVGDSSARGQTLRLLTAMARQLKEGSAGGKRASWRFCSQVRLKSRRRTGRQCKRKRSAARPRRVTRTASWMTGTIAGRTPSSGP